MTADLDEARRFVRDVLSVLGPIPASEDARIERYAQIIAKELAEARSARVQGPQGVAGGSREIVRIVW